MMGKPAFVSVVIPCYNAAETIVACLSSVVNQTFKDFNVLIIDDGSTDNTRALIQAFVEDGRHSEVIRLITQENSGPSVARNKGVQRSDASWVAFLDSDDFWEPEKLMMQTSCVLDHPEFALLGVLDVNAQGDGLELLSEIPFSKLLFSNAFRTSGVMMKRSVALEHPFDEQMKYSEDYRVWLLVAARHKVGLVNRPLCGSISNKRAFGSSGLSGNLKAMQKGEISNYNYLHDNGLIGAGKYAQCLTYSYLKYLRRIMISFAAK